MTARLLTTLTAPAVLGVLLVAACSGPSAPTVAATAPEEPATGGPAGSWPMYGGTPQRNLVDLVDKNLPTDWSIKKGAEKNIKWVAELGDRGYLPPAISGGKIFIPTNNRKPRDPKVKGAKAVLMCFRESDGRFLWQITHDMPPADVVTLAKDDGLLSTPAVEGDRLYFVTPAVEVVCADTDGHVVWRLDLMKELKVVPCYVTYCSPLVVGDLVFAVTGNGRLGGDNDNSFPSPEAPSFVAVHKKTGKLAWKDSSPGDKIMEGQWASPAYAEVNGKGQVIFPGGDGWLYAFEPESGKLIWKFDCNPKDAVFKPGGRGSTRNYLMAPVVHDNKVYTGVGQNPENGADVSHLWCIDATKSGDVSAELAKGKPNPNSAVVWHYGGPAPAGSKRDFVFGRSIGSCAVHDGLVYATELDGFLHCLDAKTGQHYWEDDLKGAVWAGPLCVDGKVYVGDDQAFVHIYSHGKEKKEINKVEMDEPIKAPVVVAGGVLYVVGDKHLYAIVGK
jgi:outer membrane protein assembly factor BamB